ncbi:MAG: multidrug efflux system membrane fusion protein [Verrucomicrobiales bacterium]|jgi:multidrug efflux system membrane fusion protein
MCSCTEEKAPPAAKPRPVFAIEVEKPRATVERSFSGLVKPAEGAPLSFEVTGRVIELSAKQGVRHIKGDVLARLDPSDYQTQLNGTQAKLTEAQQSKRRTQTLFESGNASKSDLEAAISTEKSAQSSFQSAQKKLNDCTLKMPYDGVIGSVSVEAQSFVSAGQEVLSLQGEGGMEFEIGLPAAEVAKVKVGMLSRVTLGSLPDVEMNAKVAEVATEAAANTTYQVALLIEGEIDPSVRSGMDGEATLTLPNGNGMGVAIPIECVVGRGTDQQFVWVLEGEGETRKVIRRVVKAGMLAPGGKVEIQEGLQPGETIVSRGVHRIEAGAEVAIATQK